jgi:transposase
MTNTKQEVMEVLTGPERRRRWSSDEKLAMMVSPEVVYEK